MPRESDLPMSRRAPRRSFCFSRVVSRRPAPRLPSKTGSQRRLLMGSPPATRPAWAAENDDSRMALGAPALALGAPHFLYWQRRSRQRLAWHHDVTHGDRLYATWAPKHRPAPAVLAGITSTLKASGAIDGALDRCRSFFRKTADGALAKRTIWARALVPDAPANRAAKAANAARARPTFAGRYDVVDLGGAAHFAQLEEPAKVADAVLAFPGQAALATKRAREDARTDLGWRHRG
jgi:hypothetical protein